MGTKTDRYPFRPTDLSPFAVCSVFRQAEYHAYAAIEGMPAASKVLELFWVTLYFELRKAIEERKRNHANVKT